jgi:AraC-like DNA-binding protein
MEKTFLSTKGMERIFNNSFPILGINYYPDCTNKPNGFHKDVILGVRLSGDPETVWNVDGKTYSVTNPCMSMLYPGWRYEIPDSGPWEVLYFSYDFGVLREFERLGIKLDRPLWDIHLDHRLSNIIDQIFFNMDNFDRYGVVDRLDMLCVQLVSEVMLSRNKAVIRDYNEEKILKIAAEIELNYRKKINIDEILQKHFISRRTFFREWKKYFSVSPNAYADNLRIRAACNLLVDSNMSVKEVALNLNIEDVAYFCRKFKMKTGLSPGKYKKNFLRT